MKNYAHLTQAERYQIAILCKAGHSMSETAPLMNRHRSTIGREIARNRGQRGYRPKQAQAFSLARMRASENGRRIPDETWIFVDARLGELWRPEQISGRLRPIVFPPSAMKPGTFQQGVRRADWYRSLRQRAPSTS